MILQLTVVGNIIQPIGVHLLVEWEEDVAPLPSTDDLAGGLALEVDGLLERLVDLSCKPRCLRVHQEEQIVNNGNDVVSLSVWVAFKYPLALEELILGGLEF